MRQLVSQRSTIFTEKDNRQVDPSQKVEENAEPGTLCTIKKLLVSVLRRTHCIPQPRLNRPDNDYEGGGKRRSRRS